MVVREAPAAPPFSQAAFAFFAALSADNTAAWFHAHAAEYRTHVERPWRALVETVAGPLAAQLPELDCQVKAGHVLSRITARWPRPDQAYRTELVAAFRPAGDDGRQPRLFMALAAEGLRAGLEVPARTAAWDTIARALAGDAVRDGPGGAGGWGESGDGPRWWLGRRSLAPGEPVGHRGITLRFQRRWSPEAAIDSVALGGEVLDTLRTTLPWYRLAAQAEPAGDDRTGDAVLLAALPRSLRAAVSAAAAAEGVSVAAFIVYALTRTVAP